MGPCPTPILAMGRGTCVNDASSPEIVMPLTLPNFIEDLQDPELAPMLSPARYISLLGMDVETLARNARVSVSAITKTPGAASVQSHLRENLRVLKAAYDISGGDLEKSLRWFRAEPLPAFGQRTAEQAVSVGQADGVIRLIDSLNGGAAG